MPPFDITRKPEPAEVKRARLQAGHTQEQAVRTIGRKGRESRKRWSEFETGARPMQRETWELYLLLTDQHPILHVLPRAA
jgi:hypothetical protein